MSRRSLLSRKRCFCWERDAHDVDQPGAIRVVPSPGHTTHRRRRPGTTAHRSVWKARDETPLGHGRGITVAIVTLRSNSCAWSTNLMRLHLLGFITNDAMRADFSFPSFTARLLTNQSALLAAPLTLPTRGPTGEIGDQGHFGLYVNGDANVRCFASMSRRGQAG